MTDVVVTKEDLLRLIKADGLKPEELFSSYELREWQRRQEVETKLREEDLAKLEAAKEEAKEEAPVGAESPYLDPARNPMIKLESD